MNVAGRGRVILENEFPSVYPSNLAKGRGMRDYDAPTSFPVVDNERTFKEDFYSTQDVRYSDFADCEGRGVSRNVDVGGQWKTPSFGNNSTAADLSPWVNKGRGYANGFNKVDNSAYQYDSGRGRGRGNFSNNFGADGKGRGFGQSGYDIDPWNKPNSSSNYANKGRGVRTNDADYGLYNSTKNSSSFGGGGFGSAGKDSSTFGGGGFGFNSSSGDKDQFPSSTFGGGRGRALPDNNKHSNFNVYPFLDNTKAPSAKNSEFYSNFGGFGSFGDGFLSEPAEEPEKFQGEYKSKSGGGFQDWATVEREMKEAEIAKWADLPPIIKHFYTEHPEVTAMTDDEADSFRLSKNNIMVEDTTKTRPVPKAVKTFGHAFYDQPEILEEIKKQKFVEPSPIQSQMWPITLSGHDVIGIAQTGTGKTLGFLLPIFVHLENQTLPRAQRDGPGCLILSPTRELALQIHQEIKKFKYKGIRSICIYGGGNRNQQIEAYLEGIDIIIATPGRLNDLVCANVIKLRSISFLVLDEADRMLDMGFEPQIKKILLDIRPDRHTVMTSATWPPGVRDLGDRYTKDAYIIVVGSLDLTACHAVTQVIEVIQDEEKREHLFDFIRCLKENEKVIVFVGKKSLADDLSSDLFRMGIKCAALHGDRDQTDREAALDDIKKGKVRILVATDVASRGLDIVDITHVYNYDFPRHMEEYVHRVGRTGRAGRVGVSITLMTRYDWRHAAELIKILEEASQEVSEDLRSMAERYARKIEENPDYGRRGGRGGFRRKEPFFMEDHL